MQIFAMIIVDSSVMFMIVLPAEYMHRFILSANWNSFSLPVFVCILCLYVLIMLEYTIQVNQSVSQNLSFTFN